jgi:hypothetical protein
VLTATQVFRKKTDAGQPLPTPWQAFRDKGIIKRRGQVHMLAAAPGGYKSVLTLAECVHARVPTLYVSLDGDAMTVGSRLIQMAAVVDQKTAEQAFLTKSDLALQVAALVPWLSFTYPSSATTDDIAHHVWAYAEARGEWPHRVVIDNLSDVADEDDAASLNRAMDDLTVLARETRAAVDVLHHVGGDYENGDMPIPLGGLRYKVGKKPALVTTLHSGAADGQLWVSVVKNRFGPHDAKGLKVRAELRVDPSLMQVTDAFVLQQ